MLKIRKISLSFVANTFSFVDKNIFCERSILVQALAFLGHAEVMGQAAALARHGAADFSLLGTQKTPIEKTELRGITLPQLEQLAR